MTRASKFPAYVLRHDPAAIGLILDHGGWASIDALLADAARHGSGLHAATLDRVLREPGKQRFETRYGLIRAAQGRSVHVDPGLEPRQPPRVLYHGTAERFPDSILNDGITEALCRLRGPVRVPDNADYHGLPFGDGFDRDFQATGESRFRLLFQSIQEEPVVELLTALNLGPADEHLHYPVQVVHLVCGIACT